MSSTEEPEVKAAEPAPADQFETVTAPAKVMRIGSMVKQLLEETHVIRSSKGTHLNRIVTRYAWPAELDLMARIAGLRLKERWADWSREPFAATSGNCVSVYGR